jgi:hypothetical protein
MLLLLLLMMMMMMTAMSVCCLWPALRASLDHADVCTMAMNGSSGAKRSRSWADGHRGGSPSWR